MTDRHKVVVVGGGFGGLHAVHGLNGPGFEVTLVDRTNHHLFQPLLYQVATGILPPGLIAPGRRGSV
jgi:NADH:quinone reductase (non-electrogenic)